MSKTQVNLLGVGIYTVSEASRLTGVSQGRIRRWLKGYTWKTGEKRFDSPAVWQRELPDIDGKTALGFLDLMEIRAVDAFLQTGVSWKTLRRAAESARTLTGYDHPFCTQRFQTDGKRVFAEIYSDTVESALVDLISSQMAFKKIVVPYLKDIDFSPQDEATRWWPLGKRRPIVIDPTRNFGQPIVNQEGVPTETLYAAWQAEESVERVADWYDVRPKVVEAAIEFEQGLAA